MIGDIMQYRALKKILAPFNPLIDEKWKDKSGIEHEIDFVIGTKTNPLILIDSKYIKYTKHAREKVNEIFMKLTSIKESYLSVNMLIAVLAGSFTNDALKTLETRGVHVFHIPFKRVAMNLRRFGVIIDWPESDTSTPEATWKRLVSMSESEKDELGDAFFDGTNIPQALPELIKRYLKDESIS
ncbi:hypothetical protein J7L00_00655 [Candidatus Bathyarchaeota archaeon]|nr:hypothetical protein [Candidatus Bathyarchaeota archaeon]